MISENAAVALDSAQAFIGLLAFFINSMEIIMILRKEKKTRSSTDFVLLSLSITDTLYASICTVISAVFIKMVVTDHETDFQLSRILYLASQASNWSSMLHLFALTIDRFLSVARPYQHRPTSEKSKKRIFMVLLAIWLLCSTLLILVCQFQPDNFFDWMKYADNIRWVTSGIVIALGLVLVPSYCFIIYRVHKMQKGPSVTYTDKINNNATNNKSDTRKKPIQIKTRLQSSQSRQELQVIITSCWIISIFVIFMVPYAVLQFVYPFYLAYFGGPLIVINSTMNAIVYCMSLYRASKHSRMRSLRRVTRDCKDTKNQLIPLTDPIPLHTAVTESVSAEGTTCNRFNN